MLLLFLPIEELSAPSASLMFEELVASATPNFTVLVEPQPLDTLGPWTAAGGGLTNTYYTPFPSYIATDIVPGGLYRRLDVVKQNDVTLTLRSSAASVNAFLGSYYFDEALERLYVSTTSGNSPENFALVGAWFTLFFSTTSVREDGQPLYAPLVTGQLPTLSSEMPDTLFGSTIADSGSIEFLNGDTLFDRLSRQYIWRNKRVSIKLGGEGLDITDFREIVQMRVNALSVTDSAAVLKLEVVGTLLNRVIPTRTFGDETIFPNMGEGVAGRPQPWLLGVARDCPIYLVDTTGNGTYRVVDMGLTVVAPQVTAVYAIHRTTQERTTLVAGVDYSTLPGTVTIINAAYHYDTHDIWADLAWGDGPSTFGNIVLRFLGYLGENFANIDSAAFQDPELNARNMGVYIREPIQAHEVIRVLEQSAGAQVYVGADGRWTTRLIRPDIPETLRELTDADFVAWDVDDNLQSVLYDVRVQYDFRVGTQDAFEASSSSDFTRYGSETTDSHRVQTYLIHPEHAQETAAHLRFFRSRPAAMIRFEERGLKLMDAQVGDLISVRRARAPVARTGRYDGHLLRIVKLEKSLGPVPIVRGVLNDLDGQTDHVARYTEVTTTISGGGGGAGFRGLMALYESGGSIIETHTVPEWATATDEERARYGFYTDINGYIDPTDPQTKHLKVAY